MDSFEPQPQPQPEQQELLSPSGFQVANTAAGIEELQQQLFDLRTLFNAALVGLVTLGLAADLFFGKQMLLVRRQIEEQERNFRQFEYEFKHNIDPEIRRIMDELHRYAAAHPEYRSTILDRYRIALAQYFTAGGSVQPAEPPPIPPPTNSAPSRSAPR